MPFNMASIRNRTLLNNVTQSQYALTRAGQISWRRGRLFALEQRFARHEESPSDKGTESECALVRKALRGVGSHAPTRCGTVDLLGRLGGADAERIAMRFARYWLPYENCVSAESNHDRKGLPMGFKLEWHLPSNCLQVGSQSIERRPPCLDEYEYATEYWEPEKGAYFWVTYNGVSDPMGLGTTRTFLGSLYRILLDLRASDLWSRNISLGA